ncbi:MAG: DUF5615 family PIN-like protein [Saprospiraceae bacterium]
MKLLFDHNISFRALEYIDQIFPNSIHVVDMKMDANTEDLAIWEFAKNNGYTIVTKDNDFESMSRLYGCPPKCDSTYLWKQIHLNNYFNSQRQL